MVKEIREDIARFLSDKYIDDMMNVQDGENFFNKDLIENDKIKEFSIGRFKSMPSDFLLVQCKSISSDSMNMSSLGDFKWASVMTISVYIEKSSTSFNASYISDIYMEKLNEAFQVFVREYKKSLLINPRLSINKYYETKDESVCLSGITKSIIECEFTFTCKNVF